MLVVGFGYTLMLVVLLSTILVADVIVIEKD